MSRIRILMCSSARKEKGGMNSVIDQLMDHSWNDEIEMSYLATHISGNLLRKTLFFIFAYLKLILLSYFNQYDIIHIHMSYRGSFFRKYYISKLCKKYKKRVIIHLHGSEFTDFYDTSSNKNKEKIEKLFLMADLTIVLGESWKNFILQITPNANVIVVNNAIKLPIYRERQQHNPFTILFLGALIKRKGVMDLLETMVSLHNKGYYIRLYLGGEGKEEEKLKKYCKEHKLSKYVIFLGWIDKMEKEDFFHKSDLFVLPSYNEGLPIAILEAISYGLPVISTDIGSISEAVIEKRNGFLSKPGEVHKLEEYIIEILQSKELWNQYSKQSRQIAELKFTEKLFFKKIEAIYVQLIKKK